MTQGSRRSWNPTLRKVREGWGTPRVAYASEIKGQTPTAYAGADSAGSDRSLSRLASLDGSRRQTIRVI